VLLKAESRGYLGVGEEFAGEQVEPARQLQSEWWGNVEDREAIVLLLGLLVALFVIAHLKQIKAFPLWPLPVIAASCLLMGWSVSIAEDVFDSYDFDVVEHFLYAAHSCLLAAWCVRLSLLGKDVSR
jgi:4-amino-4-deoxy-L-arabinose transferase-like glycosyltransferase